MMKPPWPSAAGGAGPAGRPQGGTDAWRCHIRGGGYRTPNRAALWEERAQGGRAGAPRGTRQGVVGCVTTGTAAAVLLLVGWLNHMPALPVLLCVPCPQLGPGGRELEEERNSLAAALERLAQVQRELAEAQRNLMLGQKQLAEQQSQLMMDGRQGPGRPSKS